jgi:exonuclease SbcC
MKILNLYFKNINSLEGESLIDFQKKPLLNAGVFAITGPNGSGKSSILDAITLALYGETFRFDRPAEHVITENTTESFAQIEFSLGDKKFKSHWQLKRKNGRVKGNLLEPTMNLFSLNKDGEKFLGESLQTVVPKVTEIIGMDFHNFSRSIMLAQGDFAAFLNALDNERMDILEKMSSANVYEEHKQQLKTKKQQSEQALAQINTELKRLTLMSEPQLQACEDDLIDFKVQLDGYRQQQNELKQQLAWYQRIKSFSRQLVDLEKKQSLSYEQLELLQKKLQKITALETAKVFEDDVEAISKQQQHFNQSKKTLDSVEYELVQLKKKQAQLNIETGVESVKGKNTVDQKQVIDKLRYQVQQKSVVLKTEIGSVELINKEINTHQAEQTEILIWLNAHTVDKSLLEGLPETQNLKQLTIDLEKRKLQYNEVEKQSTAAQQSLEKIKDSESLEVQKIVETKKDIIEAEQVLEEMINESPLIERQQLVEDQQQRTNNFKELYTLAKINNRVTKSGFLGLFSNKKIDEGFTIEQLEQEASVLTGQISEARFLRNTLEKAIINEKLLKKLLQHRTHLENGKPCPLCGALEHPFSKNIPREMDSQQALKDQNIKLQLLIIKADKIKKQILNTQKLNKKEKANDNNLQKNRSQWRILSNKLNVASTKLDIDNFSLMKQLLKKEEDDLNQFKQHLGIFQQQELLINRLKNRLVTEKENAARLKAELVKLQVRTDELPQTLATLKTQLDKIKVDEHALRDKTIKQLALLGEKMPVKNKDALLAKRLKARLQDYRIYLERELQVKSKLAQLNKELTERQQKIKQLNAEISQNEQALAVEESIGLHLALAEKQIQVTNEKESFEQQRQQLQQLELALKEKLRSSQFVNLEALRKALALVAEQETVEQNYSSLQQQLDYLETEHQQLQTKLKAEKNLKLSQDDNETLEAKKRALNEKISIANDEIRYLSNKQHQQDTMQQQYCLLSEKLQQQQQHFNESEANLKISEENGIVFRRRVQLKIATQLLSQTNKILEKISGRYYIRQAPSETGLALEIEDTKQQNSRRLPKSLSGGESFVVSLALALGLSELANNGKAVNSLFLDEGFGALDSETLYTVVSTLQSLQAQGKTVGVISHVDGVRKRIKTRIEMIKKPNGLSKLRKIS